MDLSHHNLAGLFAQLGLDNTPVEIKSFIRVNQGLAAEIKLQDAKFWNSAQSSFIEQAIFEDSDWSEIVDILDSMLR